jgi:hypothetical protein
MSDVRALRASTPASIESLVERADDAGETLPPCCRENAAASGESAAPADFVAIEAGGARQQFREPQRWLVVERGAGRDERGCLCGERVDDAARRVAQGVDCPALHEVQVSLAVGVPDVGALPTLQAQRVGRKQRKGTQRR